MGWVLTHSPEPAYARNWQHNARYTGILLPIRSHEDSGRGRALSRVGR